MSVPKLSRLTVRDWTTRVMPSFKGRKAFVLPGAFYGSVVSLMAECGFTKTETVDDADVVVFIGGSDINPALYEQTPHNTTSFDASRCIYEEAIYHQCLEKKKVMFGICRGAQFLHAMNGGVLWQHVNNHGREHMVIDVEENVRFLSSSMHHQMLQDNTKLQVIAVCEKQIATSFEDDTMYIDLNAKGNNSTSELEIEAGCYPETRCFFTQGHPEVGPIEYSAWTMQKLHDFFFDWEAVNNSEDTHELIQHLNNIGSITT